MNLGERRLDELNCHGKLCDTGINCVMAEKPQVGIRLGIHEPFARDLTIDLGDRSRKLVVDRICGPPKTVRATHNINSELLGQFGLHTLILGDIVRLSNYLAFCGSEELVVIITPVGTCHTIAWAAFDAEQLLIVGVATSCELPGSRRLY